MSGNTLAATLDRAPRVSSAPAERPQLTSLVDMMVILVVFLLHSFSAEEQFLTPAPGIDLPVSSTQGASPTGLPLVVGARAVRLGDQELAAVEAPDLEDRLAAALISARTAGPEQPLAVQVDRGVPFKVLGRVLAACTAAGWPQVQLVVQEEAS